MLSEGQEALNTPAQHAAYGIAAAIKGDFELAVRHLRIALTAEPRNAKYVLELGRALIGARNYADALTTLEEAYRLAEKEGDAIEVVKPLMLAGLYVGAPSGFDKTIAYGEQFATTSQGPICGLINRYLACAYGQKYTHNKDVQKLGDESDEQKRGCATLHCRPSSVIWIPGQALGENVSVLS